MDVAVHFAITEKVPELTTGKLPTEYGGNSNDELGILICVAKKKKTSQIAVGIFLWEYNLFHPIPYYLHLHLFIKNGSDWEA